MNRARRRLMENVQQEQVRIVPLNEFFGLPDFELTYEYFFVWRDYGTGECYLVESTYNKAYTNSSTFYYLLFNGKDYGGNVHQENVEYNHYKLINDEWVLQPKAKNGYVVTMARVSRLLSTIDAIYPNGNVGIGINFSWEYELIEVQAEYTKSLYSGDNSVKTTPLKYFADKQGYKLSIAGTYSFENVNIPTSIKENTSADVPLIYFKLVAYSNKLTYNVLANTVGTKAIQNDDGTITPMTVTSKSGVLNPITLYNSAKDVTNSNTQFNVRNCSGNATVKYTMWRWK